MKEKRKHTRIPLEIEANIKYAEKSLKGKTKNISFGGVYIELKDISCFTPEDICDVTLILKNEMSVNISFKCKIIHIFESGMGMQFKSIEGIDCYEHFKNLMVFNSKEPEKLLEELEKHPGIIMK